MIAQGTQPGYPWRLVVERKPASSGFEVAWTFQRGDSFPDDDQMTAEEPVSLALQVPSDTDPYPKVVGAVTERAARIRMTLARDGVPLAPVELRPIDGGVDIPANYFIAFAPGGTRLAELVLLDDRGATICGQRFDARPGHPPVYIDRAGDCMRLNGVR